MVGKTEFFEDVASALDSWTSTAVNAVMDGSTDLQWVDDEAPYRKLEAILKSADMPEQEVRRVFAECFRGLAVSFLTVLDGGTALADRGERVYLVDGQGKRLGDGLHDEFVSYLMTTGRLK